MGYVVSHILSAMYTRFIKLHRKEGRNSHVTQDHIGVCHMKTNMNKKASEHMNFRAYTRHTTISTDKNVVSGSSHDQLDFSFPCSGAQTGAWTYVEREYPIYLEFLQVT
jgi:hypothetical protein